MIRILSLCIAVCVVPASVGKSEENPPSASARDLAALQGLWRGSWGGGGDDEVVRQPVVAELYIARGRAEWKGLMMPNGSGVISLHGSDKRRWGRFTFSASPKVKSQGHSVVFDYGMKDETLTLKIGDDGERFSLKRIAVGQAPFADMNVTFETARGIDGEGNLLVTTFHAIRVGDRGPELSSPQSLVRPLTNASIFRVESDGTNEINIEDARRLLRNDTPVVLASRSARNAKQTADWGLSRKLGKLHPDSEAGQRTLANLLKRGTLIFVVPAAERIPIP